MDRNVRLLLCYEGTDFHGWQRQPGFRTVQGEVEGRLRRVVREELSLIGSGRTDAGVHAVGQVANFHTTSDIPTDKLRRAIGSRLPADVGVRWVDDVALSFHASRSAVSKLYRYSIHADRGRPVSRSVQRRRFHFWEPLDVEAMRAGAVQFVGVHDFTAMAPVSCVRESMVRTVFRCDVERHLDEVRVDVEGSGFLYNQVRNMVGTLIEVGRGRWRPERVAEILAGRDRRLGGPTAPPEGLCLRWVRYRAEDLRSGQEEPLADARGSERSGSAGASPSQRDRGSDRPASDSEL